MGHPNPHKQWLTIVVAQRVLRDCKQRVEEGKTELLQEIARVASRPIGTAVVQSSGAQKAKQEGYAVLQEHGQAGIEAMRVVGGDAAANLCVVDTIHYRFSHVSFPSGWSTSKQPTPATAAQPTAPPPLRCALHAGKTPRRQWRGTWPWQRARRRSSTTWSATSKRATATRTRFSLRTWQHKWSNCGAWRVLFFFLACVDNGSHCL